MIFLGAGVLVYVAWHFWPANPEVNKSVICSGQAINKEIISRSVYFESKSRNHSKLGNPLGCIQTVNRASKSQFQNAVEIWTVSPAKGFYLFPELGSTWNFYNENVECNSRVWCIGIKGVDEIASRQHFEQLLRLKIPDGFHPFYGETALWIDQDPSRFAQIGWLSYSCEMTKPASSTFFQEFDNGIMLGIYSAGEKDSSAQIYIIYNDKTFTIDDSGSGHIVGAQCAD